MAWKCVVCETINNRRLVKCEVCDTVRPDLNQSADGARKEIACEKVESNSQFKSIEEYLYEIRTPARRFEKHLLKASFYVKWFAFILIALSAFFLYKKFSP